MREIKVRFSNIKYVASVLIAAGVVSGCAFYQDRVGPTKEVSVIKPVTTAEGGSTATTPDQYKRELGQRIVEVNSNKVYVTRPQALLRAVIVVRFLVDAQGGLVRSEIYRSNHDQSLESIAMAALRSTAPFPKPPPALLMNGRLEVSETWLFNDDGKFQIRSVAQPQMDH